MQLARCAYCDRPTGAKHDDGHVEHFRGQAEHQHLELAWDNLFWSCNDEGTCGKHKDKCSHTSGPRRRFNSDQILNPSNDDPNDYLQFVSDGHVRPREGLSAELQARANETLRVFQLDASPLLTELRRDSVQMLVRAVDFLSDTPPLLRRYVDKEISQASSRPFSLAVCQFLMSVRPQ